MSDPVPSEPTVIIANTGAASASKALQVNCNLLSGALSEDCGALLMLTLSLSEL
jgi:hypothetical protein